MNYVVICTLVMFGLCLLGLLGEYWSVYALMGCICLLCAIGSWGQFA